MLETTEALLEGYRRNREVDDRKMISRSTRPWRRMWLVKDEGFSKTEKKTDKEE